MIEERNKTPIVANNTLGEIIEETDESSGDDIRKPFDPTKIDMTVKPLIIDSLIKRMSSKPPRIDLNTEFQRLGNLWSEDVQSRLIESLLVRIPLPAFYFDGTDDNNWKVVDGLQRLTTLKRFIIDKNLKLNGLEFRTDLKNKGFDDLPLFLRGRIEETQITVYIINPGTPDDVKFNIFKRINTGGLILKPQEIRHALNQGIPADFIKELAELKEFHQATHGLFTGHERMADRDLVNRFVAFYNGYDQYQSDLDEFLFNSMRNLRDMPEGKRKKIKEDFIKSMVVAKKIFDDYAFRKFEKRKDRKCPLNRALFDAWSVTLAHLENDQLIRLIKNKERVIDGFIELMNSDQDFRYSITTSTGKLSAVKTRHLKIKKLVEECLHDRKN